MSEYRYIALTNSGQSVEGTKTADSESEVVESLKASGLTPVLVEEKIAFNLNKAINVEIGGISLAERVIFTKQLSTMIGANIPIVQALDILIQQTEKPSIKEKFSRVYKSVESGISLSEAFKKEGGLLNEIQINLMMAGEKSGNLTEMLQKIAEDLEKSKKLRGKVSGALIYPAIIMVVMIGVMFVMITFMVPQVKQLYQSLGESELPFITQFLVTIGESFGRIESILIILILGASTFAGYKYYYGTEAGKLRIDAFKLRIPVFGNLSRKVEVSEFCRIMSMLLASGIPVIDAMEITGKAMGNAVFSQIVFKTKEEVTLGNSMSIGMAKYNKKSGFPPILIRMLATAEESGKVGFVLQDLANFYQEEVDQIAGNLSKLVEPIILVIVGLMVGFLAVAIYLPIYQVGQIVGQ
jgi:type IV pilus assembly protein PilC